MSNVTNITNCPFCGADTITKSGTNFSIITAEYACGCKIHASINLESNNYNVEIVNECTNKLNDISKPKCIICDCGSYEHQLFVYTDGDFSDNHREVIISPHLITYNNVFKRIWVAIKYIFCYKSKYGAWDEIVITKRNYQPLKDAINFLDNK